MATQESARFVPKGLRTYQSLYEVIEKNKSERRALPQDLGLEQSILGAMIIDKYAADRVVEILGLRTADDSPFYLNKHTVVYQAIVNCIAESLDVDLLSVTNALRKSSLLESIGGVPYLVELTTNVVTTANVGTHCKLLLQQDIARRTIIECMNTISRMFEREDVFEVLDQHQTVLFNLSDTRNTAKSTIHSLRAVRDNTLKEIDEIKDPSGIRGVPTGIQSVDAILGGLKKGHMVVVAGRPSDGKTAFAIQIMLNAMNYVIPEKRAKALMFSLEMGHTDLGLRIIANQGRINLKRLESNRLTEWEIKSLPRAVDALENDDIFIDDSSELTIFDIRARAKRYVQREGVGLIVIDYLQLITPHGKFDSENREITEISKGIKRLAKELQVPIMALSQLSRDQEKQGNRPPRSSDLRGSGSIEQDADEIIFLYNRSKNLDEGARESPTFGQGSIREAHITKQRQGPKGIANLRFFGEYSLFEDSDPVVVVENETPYHTAIDTRYEKEEDENELPF